MVEKPDSKEMYVAVSVNFVGVLETTACFLGSIFGPLIGGNYHITTNCHTLLRKHGIFVASLYKPEVGLPPQNTNSF